MVQLAAMRITSAVGAPAIYSPLSRQMHSSVCLMRGGITIGGGGGGAERASSSPSQQAVSQERVGVGRGREGESERTLFSSLRREVGQQVKPPPSVPAPQADSLHVQSPQQEPPRQVRHAPAERTQRLSNALSDLGRTAEPSRTRSPVTSHEARAEQDARNRRQKQQQQRARKDDVSVQDILRTPRQPVSVAQSAPSEKVSVPEWDTLRRRIEQGQAEEALEAEARGAAESPQGQLYSRVRRPLLDMQIGKASAKIESISQWHVASTGISRSYTFEHPVATRMFLQAATSILLSETEWQGEVSLQRKRGVESVRVVLGGSMPVHEDKLRKPVMPQHDAVTEHDVRLAELLDRFTISVPRPRKERLSPARRSTADRTSSSSKVDEVVPVAVQAEQVSTRKAATEGVASPAASPQGGASPSAPTRVDESIPVAVQAEQVPGGQAETEGVASPAASSQEGTHLSAPTKVDESIPVAVQAEQVPGGEAATEGANDAVDSSHEPFNRVLGTDEESSAGAPIEESVPVPNLEHERSDRSSEGRGAAVGKAVNVARRNNGSAESQSWTSDQSMQQSQRTWSHISSSKDEPSLRIDENVPVEVDGKQVGKHGGEGK